MRNVGSHGSDGDFPVVRHVVYRFFCASLFISLKMNILLEIRINQVASAIVLEIDKILKFNQFQNNTRHRTKNALMVNGGMLELLQ